MGLHSGANFEDGMDPADVAVGALDPLGKGPNWIPGEPNRAGARAMGPVPRVGLINGMSKSCAELSASHASRGQRVPRRLSMALPPRLDSG